ncbi:probable disease resistance protein At4g27220 [Durio zibethinus]|uniref:Probable disease resistance protein At4g27220 n=1 Tax=Durio zibethinus TaxID=66656 RepID=A0A6P5Z5A4_DURZI|nr:probable disease resistance protein At4g27220 [Durio zibethinus]
MAHFDIKKIQELIADELGLKFETQSEPGRAGELRNRLKKSKVLVILDDIWDKLDMEALGVPYGGEHQGCKILLTSRKVDALSLMGSLKNIPIEILKEEEAWNLFKKKAGDIVLSPDLETTAIEVANECAGLPIAIVTVAEAMKNKENLSDWKYALNELRNPSKRNFKGIPAGAYSAIELSYKFLEDVEHQPTFLLCSIMGHDAAIEDLLKFGIGLGLFHGVNTIEETRYKASALVSDLKRSSLLLDGSTFERFDMHDVVHDVAMSIASRDHHWLARDDEFKELSNEETMRNCELICLEYAKVCELPDHDQLECPNLTFVSLSSEDSSLKISDNFFRGMQKLRVLDFAKMYFPSMPSSFCFLKNLRTLCFSDCILKDIVIIKELKNLEILSFSASEIAELPSQIGQLIKLKLLDLSYCYNLKVIPPNVLSSLSRLEELYLYESFDRWEVEGHEKKRTNASPIELQHLSHLTTLEVHIPIVQAMPKELFSEKLERYRIFIGEKLWCYESKKSRELRLMLNKRIHLDDSGVKTLLRKTETLRQDAVKDAMDMLCDPDTEGFPHLKLLDGRNDSEVKHLINSMELASCKAFPLLETLRLFKLNNLEAIYYGQLQAECFGQLREIEVRDCNMLKNLFSFALARKLGHLQEIYVSNCENFTELIVEKREEEIGDDDILEFSQLRSLTLKYLPSFIGLFNSEEKLSSSQQGRVQSMDGSSTARSLFDQKVVFPCLKELWLDSIIVEKLWHDQLSVTSFGVENLTELSVQDCHNLKNLFTSSMVESFVQPKSLSIGNCNEIEEVITVTEGLLEEVRMKKMVFPKLDSLKLWNLPNLKRFCFGNPNEFLYLRERRIAECPVLNTFHSDSTSVGTIVGNEAGKSSISMVNPCTDVPKYLFDEKVVFLSLEELHLSSIVVRKLWYEQHSVNSFGVQNLTKLEVHFYHNLKNIFTSSMVESFVQLKTLYVVNCNKIEEIITVTEGLVEEEERMRKMVFPKLDYFELKDLPNLKRFGFGNMIEFPSLRNLHIEGCPVLNTVHSDSTNMGTTAGNEAGKNSISMENFQTAVSKYLFNEKIKLYIE